MRAYRKAERYRQKKMNWELWLQGHYVMDAFGTVLANAFAKKGQAPAQYFQEPLPLTEKEAKEQAERQAIRKREQLRARFESSLKRLKIKEAGAGQKKESAAK